MKRMSMYERAMKCLNFKETLTESERKRIWYVFGDNLAGSCGILSEEKERGGRDYGQHDQLCEREYEYI